MGLLSWIILGLIAGWIAGKVVDAPDSGCVTRIAVGVIGALVGGALARAAGYEGINRFGLRSILLAAIGATVFLLVLGAIEGRPRRRGQGRRRARR
ncbi:MAG TPA: GlsB/YeaQ/YmgE family stress response membrane protein [Acidimicrobiales bacterium]|jgi:uncharacterized membrane protein YeaQ/YmgE (transglycosylase-associated protein family)|nr:GlsB/YeaQ/YmgE family stress response membrane protein [Acidimicrobiales bacterium]